MLERIILDEADLLSGGRLRLIPRGDEFSIMLNLPREGWNELMNSRRSGSEQALATLALRGAPARARVLIGGLGMGFTLRAALAVLDPRASVTVSELVPEVIAWGRGPMADLHAGTLDDPRVTIIPADVGELIREDGAAYDAILLDVDNGPAGLTRVDNAGLYGARGLAVTKRALAPGGVVAIWSAEADPAFGRRLEKAGFTVDTVTEHAHASGKGAKHTIWLARI